MNNLLKTIGALSIFGLVLTGCSSSEDTASEDAESQEQDSTQTAAEILPEEIQESGVLTLGSPTTSRPHIFLEEGESQPIGIIPDLAEAVGEQLDVELVFEDIPFSGLIPAIQADRIDAAWTLLSVTDERLEVISFLNYIKTSRTFLVQAGNPADIGDLTTLCGTSLGVLRGEAALPTIEKASDDCLDNDEAEITIRLYDDPGEGRTQVQSGVNDAWVGNRAPLQNAADTVEGGEVFDVADFTFAESPFGIGLAKDDQQLAQALQQALLEVKESGQYDEILAAYDAEQDSMTADEIIIEE